MTTFAIPVNAGVDLYTYDGTTFTRRQQIQGLALTITPSSPVTNWDDTGFIVAEVTRGNLSVYAIHISSTRGVSLSRRILFQSSSVKSVVISGGTINSSNNFEGPFRLIRAHSGIVDVHASPTISSSGTITRGDTTKSIGVGNPLANKLIDSAGPQRFIAYDSRSQTFTGYFAATGNRITDAQLNVLPNFIADTTFLDNITGWWHDGEYIYRSNGTDIRRWAWQLI